MAYLNNTTKKAQQLISNYEHAKYSELFQVYGNYSYAKERAYNYCRNVRKELKGKYFRITSYNSQIFTVGFLYHENGNIYLYYITPCNEYKILWKEAEGK